jgi:FKBP-type peptidyl-prolyl cis-trans isomerase
MLLYMRKFYCCFAAVVLLFIQVDAQKTNYPLADSAKTVQLWAEISVQQSPVKGRSGVGIATPFVQLELENEGEDKEVVFRFPKGSKVVATGIDVEAEDEEFEWDYDWQLNQPYQLLLSIANDSASNMVLYSGYLFLPEKKQWKFIGTCQIQGNWQYITNPAVFTYAKKRKQQKLWKIQNTSLFTQRSNGRWKNLLANEKPNPTVVVTNHIDSAKQYAAEIKAIEDRIAKQTTDVKQQYEGVYYSIMKEGNGRLVKVTDTVVIHYKGYLFDNDAVFDQTKDKPATFPLSRLIKGWQIGVPLCRVGGKIKLVIPSALGYSIRTRSPKIPPNSILVFEIEVLEVK